MRWTDQFGGCAQETSSRSNQLGELGGKLLPYFGYKRGVGGWGKGLSTLGIQNSLKISEKKKKEKIKAEELSYRFRDVSVINFVDVLHRSSFILHPSSIFNQLAFDFEALNSFYAPFGFHSCFVCLHLYSSTLGILFLHFKWVSTECLSRNLT